MAYLESLLWRIGGLTVDEAKVVPGGVKLSHRVAGEASRDRRDAERRNRVAVVRERRGGESGSFLERPFQER